MNLSAGEHYMQVSKWMGHSSFVLTLTTYADYITEGEQPVPKVGRETATASNVIALQKLDSNAAKTRTCLRNAAWTIDGSQAASYDRACDHPADGRQESVQSEYGRTAL